MKESYRPAWGAAMAALLASGWAAAPAAPAPIGLHVDLSDATRKIFSTRETIPVQAGALRLEYPKWIPGEHSPSGTIGGVTGLKITGNGQAIAWRRDLRDMFVVNVEVPAGVSEIQLQFEFLSPTSGGEFGQSVSATPRIVDLEWNQVLFYPGGENSLTQPIQASVTIPAGWQFATALEREGGQANETRFKTVSLEQLVDSPLIAGLNFRRIDLAPGAKVPVHLDLVSDQPANLEVSAAQISAHRELVTQANALFGGHHYQHYDFLFTLSDSTGHFGLEHHQSSDDRLESKFFTDTDSYATGADLLPHEYVHSWNGKFRRPAGLLTKSLHEPMEDELLWVYEGLTQYLGEVLTARSGLWTPQQYRDVLAETAAGMSQRTGRSWRSLQDTADEAQVLYFVPDAWANYRRTVDYYPEGALLWLDVDTRIRELSNGKRSLDDFTKAFYGIDGDSFMPRPYNFDDIVNTLAAVQANDWRKFLRDRLDYVGDQAPLEGIARGGWKLTYDDQRSAYSKSNEENRHSVDLMASVGLLLAAGGDDNEAGLISDVLWSGPAFDAGMAPGMTVVAVNDIKFSAEGLRAAITDAKTSGKPIRLLARNLDTFTTFNVDYRGGLRYPHLTRGEGSDRLSQIVARRN
ncbi:MAG: M61 family peptidase [Arenimonas sp.]